MDKEIKREAWKQYLHYFRFWFIIIGIMAVVCVGGMILHMGKNGTGGRKNSSAPAERVYDYADVLNNEEEQKLRDYIADCEKKYHIDLVLVTINEDVESRGNWETVMMNRADDFYDENQFGYNKVHGDGALLLDNWYTDDYGSQKGSWLSTCGIVEDRLGNYEINQVLDAVYYKADYSPYEAYREYVDNTCKYVRAGENRIRIPFLGILLLPVLVAVIYAVSHLIHSSDKKTVPAAAYVADGKPHVRDQQDDFIRKSVVTRRIESGSGGGSSSGGGGHHRSSGGVSHGGGGRRR